MNRKQVTVLVIGLVLTALVILLPPWRGEAEDTHFDPSREEWVTVKYKALVHRGQPITALWLGDDASFQALSRDPKTGDIIVYKPTMDGSVIRGFERISREYEASPGATSGGTIRWGINHGRLLVECGAIVAATLISLFVFRGRKTRGEWATK